MSKHQKEKRKQHLKKAKSKRKLQYLQRKSGKQQSEEDSSTCTELQTEELKHNQETETNGAQESKPYEKDPLFQGFLKYSSYKVKMNWLEKRAPYYEKEIAYDQGRNKVS